MTKLNDKLSGVDAAIAAAKSRRSKRASDAGETNRAPAEKAERKPRTKLTDEQKAERTAAKDAEKAQKKAAREARKAAKAAEKAAARKPAHMAKVQRAADRLPSLSERAGSIYNEITANLSRDQVAALALHLTHFNRVMATTNALAVKIEAGMQVTIVGGDPRFVGKTGTVEKAQRIRCYVNVEGFKKPVYLFTSDVSPVEGSQAAAANG